MVFLRIQTNRAKIKDIIGHFSKGAVEGEALIVPRPLPRESFKFYIGYSVVERGSANHALLSKLNNHREILEEEYRSDVAKVEYSWRVQK